MSEAWLFVILAAVFFLAGLVQGATGFGSGLLALALLGLFLDVREVAVLNAIVALPLVFMIFWRFRRHVNIRPHRPVILSILIGVAGGVVFLAEAAGPLLLTGLGVVMMIAASNGLLPDILKPRKWHPVWLGIPAGLAGGLLTGAFGTGGPPLIAYLATQGYERLRFVGTLQLLLLIGGVFRIGILCFSGLITGEILRMSVVSLVFILIGAAVGMRLLEGISDRWFRRILLLLLIALGLRYLYLGLQAFWLGG